MTLPPLLTLPVALALPRDISEYSLEIIATTLGFASMFVVIVYIRQLDARHRRLLEHLGQELAERKRAEERLKASEGFYHSLVESLPASILRKDLDGSFTFGNQKFCEALEVHDPFELVGKTDFDFFPKALAEKYRADDRRVIASGLTFETVEDHVTAHGERLSVQVIKTPLKDVTGNTIGVQGIFWDVTARKQAEEQLVERNARLAEMAESKRKAYDALKQAQSQLVQAEKLASLGLVVAGVAHEINNPIAFVTNNVVVLGRDIGEIRELLHKYEKADDLIGREQHELFKEIQDFREQVDIAYTLENLDGLLSRSRDGLKRIQQIVSHLRMFAHLDEGDVNEADLNEGIESTCAIVIGNARRKQVQLDVQLQPLPPITCHAAKINQVILNLLSNAIDACPEGGVVSVRTAAEPEHVVIEVIDNGCGMDPATRERIFDPFFTTKPIGEGTGLGLSISYGIIKDHGGVIEVESTAGLGSRFLVRLPLRSPARPSGHPGESSPVITSPAGP